MAFKQLPCPCGSGLQSSWQHDARGIPMCRTCVKCHTAKMDGYRADVINNPNYDADEDIEERW
ncbi:MAG: hypothetical protein EOQ44_25170 [Mesorhizobium sp.]|uniref:hypothetical protein n=1 Tax=Mesorhizobium sp. TaxID=1871066 RepID=UPI000FE6B89C|nr:hypothetical protein [Mesorhizobium sp.]RWB40437.1 MAG: hypothetical protein EOQ44_25170 [Mesorhizobium sp.]